MLHQKIPILLYHSVAETVAPKFAPWSVTPEMFNAQMAYLSENHYTPITVSALVNALQGITGAVLPANPVVITFDDGFADFYTTALPTLKRHGFASTMYIATKYVGETSRWLEAEGEGNRPLMTWDQIVEISQSGVELGCHSHSHPQMDVLSRQAVELEILQSKQLLDHHLSVPVVTFAYPHGYHTNAIKQLVKKAGYQSACAVKHAMFVTGVRDYYSLGRMFVFRDTNIEGFAQLLRGENLPVAWDQEKIQTKIWRLIRKIRYRMRM